MFDCLCPNDFCEPYDFVPNECAVNKHTNTNTNTEVLYR